MQRVDVPALQPKQLPEARPADRCEQDEGAVPLIDPIGDLDDDRQVDEGPLGMMLRTCALHLGTGCAGSSRRRLRLAQTHHPQPRSRHASRVRIALLPRPRLVPTERLARETKYRP
jgi:hypothetical protein